MVVDPVGRSTGRQNAWQNGWRVCGLAMVLGAALSACATPPLTRDTDAAVPFDAPGESSAFDAAGRISIVAGAASETGHGRSLSGKFTWAERSGDGSPHTVISLFSPLGDTLANVSVGPGRAELRTTQGSETDVTPEQLLARTLDISLPVSGLRWWLRGRARDGSQRAPDDFDEDGWRIRYPQMEGARPRIVRLERDLPERVEVRIVIDEWRGSP